MAPINTRRRYMPARQPALVLATAALNRIAWPDRLANVIGNTMLFFVWYDDTPKKLAIDKLQEAIAAYTVRFNTLPNLVLANAADQLGATDVAVRYERTVQPNTFWLGFEDLADRLVV